MPLAVRKRGGALEATARRPELSKVTVGGTGKGGQCVRGRPGKPSEAKSPGPFLGH